MLFYGVLLIKVGSCTDGWKEKKIGYKMSKTYRRDDRSDEILRTFSQRAVSIMIHRFVQSYL